MPYPNYPNFQQQFPNYFNQPMQQQMLQQFPNMMNNNILPGKVIDSFETVKVTDIPMDGNMHYFPKADGSEIYVKRWLPNGSTEVVTYSKVIDVPVETKPEIDFNLMESNIIEKLNSIDERIGKIEKGIIQKPKTNKEV